MKNASASHPIDGCRTNSFWNTAAIFLGRVEARTSRSKSENPSLNTSASVSRLAFREMLRIAFGENQKKPSQFSHFSAHSGDIRRSKPDSCEIFAWKARFDLPTKA